jgi:hypothetical protein
LKKGLLSVKKSELKALNLTFVHMKKLIFTIFVFASFLSKAQNWQNAVLRADGVTAINGVEAYCMQTICNNEEVVLVKFINKNNYKVRLEWVDAIFVNGVWYYPQNKNPKVFYVEANSETAGECAGQEKLKVKIGSIIDNPKNFGHYTVSGLVINQ